LRLDTIALSLTRDMALVGTYNTAFRLFELFLSFVVIAAIALFPAVARSFVFDNNMRDRFVQSFRLVMLAGFPFVITLITFSGWMVKTAYDGRFPQSQPIFCILIVMLFLYVTDRIFSTIVHSAKRPELDRNALLSGAVVFCGLLAVLVPSAGVAGAALSSAGAQFFILIVRWFQLRKHFGWSGFLKNSRIVFLAATIMAAAYLALGSLVTPPLTLPISLIIYCGILAATGELSPKKFSILFSKVQLAASPEGEPSA
jgi:O-antigen/teichoic acid export membrane protein